ncbi:MAG TPA: zinc-dependent alcohol dehydrogenase family protein [Thermoleophilia bacterium]|nr:zinc-dependent alcohol dehydrogenase family protein [Thermoleophilia bacterium]
MAGTGAPATMRAMQLAAPAPVAEAPLRLVELPVPAPGPGEVLLRVLACGVCRTDLHILEGELPPHRSPVVPGHQIVGEVVALGRGTELVAPGGEPGAPALAAGDRVGVPWLHRTDGSCRFCARGRENLCEHALFTGWDVDGGFAEYTVAPAGFVYRLPAGMTAMAAAPLLCAGIIGYRCLRLVGIVGDDGALPGGVAAFASDGASAGGAPAGGHASAPKRLAIYGFGSAASLCTQVAIWRGWEVYGIARDAEHRAMARELGAVWAGEANDDPGVVYDAAIVFAPAGELAVDALRRLDKGGVVALGGIYSSPIPPIEYPWIYHERIVRSVANSTRQDARELLRDAAAIPIVSRVQEYELEQANEALLDLKEDRVRGSAVLRVAGD